MINKRRFKINETKRTTVLSIQLTAIIANRRTLSFVVTTNRVYH